MLMASLIITPLYPVRSVLDIPSYDDKILLVVASYPLAHLVTLAASLVVGIAFNGLEECLLCLQYDSRMHPISGRPPDQEQGTGSNELPLLRLCFRKKDPFFLGLFCEDIAGNR